MEKINIIPKFKLNIQLFADNDENTEEIEDEDLEEGDEEDENVEEDQQEESQEDEYDDIFKEDEEFDVKDLNLESIEGYEENKDVYNAVAKRIFDTGAGKKAIAPIMKEFGQVLDSMEKEYSSPISKEKFKELEAEQRTNYSKVHTEVKAKLTKEEMSLFQKTFNSKEKIALVNKLFGNKSDTGNTDYENGGRRTKTSDSFDEFGKKLNYLTKNTIGKPELRAKKTKELYEVYGQTANKSIKDFISENPYK